GVAGAGGEEGVARLSAVAQKPGQFFVDFAASLSVTPGGHDDRAGENAGALRAGPGDGLQKCLRMIRLPVGEQQLRVRRQGVNHFGAQHTMLTGTRLEATVETERANGDFSGERLAQMRGVALKAGIENGD